MDTNKNRHNFSALLFVLTVFSFGLIFLRFSEIMVHGEIDGQDLEENVERLYTRNHTLQANRGTIYDRYGNPIAIDAVSYKMIAVLTDKWSTETDAQHVTDTKAVADILSQHINLSSEEAERFLTKDVDQIEFGSAGNNLSYHTALNIENDLEAAELSGIIFEEKQKRLYPNGTFASHTVGLAQYPIDDEGTEAAEEKQLEGVMGLEASYNELLTGTNGQKTYKKDSFGYLIPNLAHQQIDPINGDDLYLTLDHKLQVHLETILDQVQSENNPKRITATVLNPETGDLIASGQRPSFNATTLENIDASWQNLLTEYTYEPGSTIKILTLAAAIEEGIFDPNKYYESGTINVHGGKVSDFVPQGWGWISYLEGLSRSSNVLFVNLVDEMGHDVWRDYLKAFGFVEKTGIELPYEQTGFVQYDWPLERVNTSFGQGISVTPVQMLQAFTTIANEGEKVQPKIVGKSVDSVSGEETLYKTETEESPISPESARLALNYFKQATEMDTSIAQNYLKEGYSIAAKTGTAQLVDSETGRYSSSKYIYSVVAMMPADDPKYLVYITVEEPEFSADATYGSAVVQKIYHPLVDRIIDFNDNSSNGQAEISNIQYTSTPSYLGMNSNEALADLSESEFNYTLIGTGEEVVQQLPYPDSPLFDDQQIILMTNGAATMPDLTQWSRNDVLKIAELTGSNFIFEGEGYVVAQSLPEGSYIDPGAEITVTLSPEASGYIPEVSVNETEDQSE